VSKKEEILLGAVIQHKKSGRKGQVLEFDDDDKPKKGRIVWDDDGEEQWVSLKQFKATLPW